MFSVMKRPDIRDIWRSLTYESCPRDYNFHMHSLYSDGRLSPNHILHQARFKGVQGFAITDHHSIEAYKELQSWLKPDDPILWSGIEIDAVFGETLVHILGYDFNPDHEAMAIYTNADYRPYFNPRIRPLLSEEEIEGVTVEEVVIAIHAAGGFAVLAHPFRYDCDVEWLVDAAAKAGCDGVEAYYNYRNPYFWIPCKERTPVLLQLAERHNLLTTCGTDSHGKSISRRL